MAEDTEVIARLSYDIEVITRLTRIETKLDASQVKVEDHEKRIRAGERRHWYAAGGIAAVVAYVAAVKAGMHSLFG